MKDKLRYGLAVVGVGIMAFILITAASSFITAVVKVLTEGWAALDNINGLSLILCAMTIIGLYVAIWLNDWKRPPIGKWGLTLLISFYLSGGGWGDVILAIGVPFDLFATLSDGVRLHLASMHFVLMNMIAVWISYVLADALTGIYWREDMLAVVWPGLSTDREAV